MKIEEPIDPHNIGQALKKQALKTIASAWESFDQVWESDFRQDINTSRQSLFAAVDNAALALNLLYSGSLEAENTTAVLNHLIVSRHFCFTNCSADYFKQFEFWRIFSTDAGLTKKEVRDYRAFIRDTETMLKSVESYLFHVNRQVYYTHEEDVYFKQKLRKVFVGLVVICLVLLSLFPVYRKLNPIQVYNSKGQFFWRSLENSGENEKDSLRFKVKCDGKFHEYTIDAIEPINILSLRFDPITEKGARIWIDYIEIHFDDQPFPILFSFDRDREYWTVNNDVTPLEIRDQSLFFISTGTDPGIRKDNLSVQNLSHIRVRMKVLLYKSYVQWIFS